MKARLIIILGFVLAFSAGVVVGVLRQRQMAIAARAATQPVTQPAERNWLARELGLSAEQAEQVRKIWSEAMRSAGDPEEQMRELRKERERKITALLRVEDIPQYDAILQEYNDRVAQFWRDHRKRIEETEEKTRAILTEEQRAKFDQLRSRHGRGGPGSRGGHRPGERDRGDRSGDRSGERSGERGGERGGERSGERGDREKSRVDRPSTRPVP